MGFVKEIAAVLILIVALPALIPLITQLPSIVMGWWSGDSSKLEEAYQQVASFYQSLLQQLQDAPKKVKQWYEENVLPLLQQLLEQLQQLLGR